MDINLDINPASDNSTATCGDVMVTVTLGPLQSILLKKKI